VESSFALLNGSTNGAAVPHLDRGLLLDLEFPLPAVKEQERIVRILDEADALRRLGAQADERMKTLVGSLYMSSFWHTDSRDAWSSASIGDLADRATGSIRTGPFGSQLLHSEFVDVGIPVLAIDNVVENEFRWTTSRCIPEAKYRQFKRYRVFPGDIAVSIMGTVGRSCVMPEDLPECMSTKHLCVITPNRDVVHPRFLWGALLYDPDVRQQTRAAGGGAIMEGWNSTIIRQIKLRVPPMFIQERFAESVANALTLESAQAARQGRLNDLLCNLLYATFRGKL
jgi:type I restriction enzyme S subunit